MSTKFDPYYQWLGIPPEEQPPHHYRLLGLKPLEKNLDVIETAADRQMLHLRTYQSGKHAVASQELLNEISAVKVLLLDPVKKRAYDATLESRLAAAKNAVDAKAQHERPLATPPVTPSPTVPPLRPATQRPLPMAKMLPDPSVAPMISDVPLATSGPLRTSSVATRGKANSVIVIAVIGVAAMLLLAIVVGAIGLSLTGGDDELAVHHSEVSAGNEDGLTPKSDGDRAHDRDV